MKQIILLSVSLLLSMSAFSQDISGSWGGVLNASGMKLPLVINISEKEGIYSATMDSPAQGAKGIPISTVNFENTKLTFSINILRVEYEGMRQADSIVGTFKQNGMAFPLNLKKTEGSPVQFARPQEPKPPYPYRSEDITFENKSAGITLAGTLTMPPSGKNFPAAILITGSGPQNRNEELYGHKPFLVLSDYLTRNGIAVLRYDDRGVAESGGNYATATLDDFASDAAAAVNYMKSRKEINPKKIGIIGHSYGATIAFMVAGEKNNDLAYMISLAGVAIPGDSLLLMQRYLIAKKMGAADEDIAKSQAFMDIVQNVVKKYSADFIMKNMNMISDEALPDSLKKVEAAKTAFNEMLKQMATPEMKSILNNNPTDALKKIKCPVLALNGEKDLQVPAEINLSRIRALVKGPVSTKKYSDLNHLFQHCETGLPDEYAGIEETISPGILTDIADWIKERTR